MFTRLTGQLYFLDIAKIHMVMIRLVCLTNVFDQNTIFGMLMNLVLNFKNDDTHQFAKVASSKKMPIIYFWRIVLSFLTHRLDHNCHLRMCVNTGTDGNVVFLIYIYIIIYIYIFVFIVHVRICSFLLGVGGMLLKIFSKLWRSTLALETRM